MHMHNCCSDCVWEALDRARPPASHGDQELLAETLLSLFLILRLGTPQLDWRHDKRL